MDKFLKSFAYLILFISILIPVNSQAFFDDFNDSSFTADNWSAGPGWSHVKLSGDNYAYQGIYNSAADPNPGAASFVEKKREYEWSDIAIDVLLRIDNTEGDDDAAGLLFLDAESNENDCTVNIESIANRFGVWNQGKEIASTMLNVKTGYWYRLKVLIDSDGSMDFFLYDADDNSKLAEMTNLLPAFPFEDAHIAVIAGEGASYDNFTLIYKNDAAAREYIFLSQNTDDTGIYGRSVLDGNNRQVTHFLKTNFGTLDSEVTSYSDIEDDGTFSITSDDLLMIGKGIFTPEGNFAALAYIDASFSMFQVMIETSINMSTSDLKGDYIGVTQGSDGENVLSTATFDGLGGGTYQELEDSNGPLDSGSFTYNINSDGTYTFDPGVGITGNGIVSSGGQVGSHIFIDDDYTEISIMIKKSTEMSIAKIKGDYFFVCYYGAANQSNEDEVDVAEINFDGAGNLTAVKDGNNIGTGTYSVETNGVFSANISDNDKEVTIFNGIASSDGNIIIMVDTDDSSDNDVNTLVGLKKSLSVDNDGDGYTQNQNDCNDTDASINPGATEICGDGIDQDCSGADLACTPDPNDTDDDGDGYTENQNDCNDNDALINPGATEICGDGIDQDCSGADLACTSDPNDTDDDNDGYTENQNDCNDNDSSINPGATEVCGDGIDQNCDGKDDVCQPTYNATGEWNFSQTLLETNCPGDVDSTEEGNLTITQSGNSFTLKEEENTYTGIIDGKTYTGSGSYIDEEGVNFSVEFIITLSSDNAGAGTINITATASSSCSAKYNFSMSLKESGGGGGGCFISNIAK